MNLLKPKVTVTVTNRTVLRVIIIILAAVVGIHLLGRLTHVLTLLFVAFFLAMALNPAVSWITKRLESRSRVRATGLAYVVVLAVIISFLSFVIPPLVSQSADFISSLPQTIQDFKTQDSATARFARRYHLDQQLDQVSHDFSNHIPQLRGQLLSTLTKIGGTLISILTVLVLTFMMLVEGPIWLEKIWAVHPPEKRDHHKELARKMYHVVTSYVNGQLIVATIAASFALVALLIASNLFHAQINPIALAGIIALGGLVPMVGNPIASTLVVIICLFSSLPLAVTMLIYFVVYYQLESLTILPYVQAKQNELTPLLVFTAALLGIGFGGILGGLIAIPSAGCIKVLFEDYFTRHKLHTEQKKA